MQRMVDAPVLHFKDGLANFRFARRISVIQLAADHGLDDTVFGNLGRTGIQRVDSLAIADHRNAVGNLQNFIQLVGNQNGGNALRLEPLEQFQQRV